MTGTVRSGAIATSLRLLSLVALTALAGVSFAGVFAPRQLALPVVLVSAAAVVVPFAIRARTRGRPAFGIATRVLAAGAGFVISCVIALRGAGAADVRDGVVDGWAHLLSAVPPVDFRGIVVAVPLLTMWAVGLVTVELEGRRRSPVLVAVPALLGAVLGAAFGVGDPAVAFGRRGVALVPAVVLAALVVRRMTSGDTVPLTLPRTLRAAAPAAVFVAVATVAGLVVGPHLPGAGTRTPAMLRDHFEPPQVTRPVVNPMALLAKAERTRAQAGAPPPTAFAVDASAPTDRFRLAVLDSYDGRQWVSTGAYAPTGHALTPIEPTGAPTAIVTQDITVVGDVGGFWLPAAGQPVEVSVPVLVDPATGTIAVAGSPGPTPGLHYVVTSNVPSFDAEQLQSARFAEGEAAAPFLEVPAGVPDSLRTLSRTATADSTYALQQMFALQEYLKSHYTRRPPAQAVPGHSLPQLTAFLTNPALGQGSPEQFAASFALLARLTGAPSRLVVGYRGAASAGRQDVTTADLTVWPEVQFADLGWVPFDPTPSESAATTETPVAAAPAPGTNAAIAEAANTPGTADVAAPETAEEESTAAEAPSNAGAWILAAVAFVVLVLPLALLAARSLRRRSRRRRRRRAPSPRQQVIGAWDEALDRLTESGVERSRVDALTAPEVVHQGAAVAGEQAATELRQLAVLANAASYSDREPSAVDATSAWAHERTFERHWAAAHTRRERMRARLH